MSAFLGRASNPLRCMGLGCIAKRITPRRILVWCGLTSFLLMYIAFHDERLLGVHTKGTEEEVALAAMAVRATTMPESLKQIIESNSGACSYTKVFSLSPDRQVTLDAQPFQGYVKDMTCRVKGHTAVFGTKFAKLDDVVVDPGKASSDRIGGENVSEVMRQREDKEYLRLGRGFFSIPCDTPPPLLFEKKSHLSKWATTLTCYTNDTKAKIDTKVSRVFKIGNETRQFRGTTIAIQRYEYANFFCTSTELYNTFLMMMLTGRDPSHVTSVLIVDAHPAGVLDSAWEALYGTVTRVRHLKGPTYFSHLVWSLISYSNPMWNVRTNQVPYLEEFRHFFLSRHGLKTDHKTNCSSLNAVIIWRRDYVAHPRNPRGVVSRKFFNEEEILQQVKTSLGPSANVTGVQMDKLTMREQLRLIATCDMLIGMHGAGLTHVLFLPSSSGFMEIFPSTMVASTNTHFQAIGRWRRLTTVTMRNVDRKREMSNQRTNLDTRQLAMNTDKLKQMICHS